MKRLAILHYHLRPGGVTTVIRNAQRALAGRFDVRLLADFGYNDTAARSRAAFLAETRALKNRLASATRGVDVLHTHNLTLGKHPRLTCAVKLLAQETAIQVINQVHDFAEDGRPGQLRALRTCTGRRDDRFWREMCYYDLPNAIWATLTTRDAARLAERGVPAGKIRVLPNPVDDEFFSRPRPSTGQLGMVRADLAAFAGAHEYDFDPGRKTLLSPMKVMARKNNAESVELVRRLNALCGRTEYQLVISLDASSPQDRAYSEKLKHAIHRGRLPVVIGFGLDRADPLPLFHLAHAILTTSKTEGFGYTFVEGWLCQKLVVGRDIPEVTRDFKAEGMDLRHLYREFNEAAVRRIARMLAQPPRKLIAHNRKVVQENYSLQAYRRRFEALLRHGLRVAL